MANLDNSSYNLDDSKIGSSVEEINILYPNKKKHIKSNQIQKYLASIIILLCLIFVFLIISDAIPFENIIDNKFKKNLSGKTNLPNNSNLSHKSKRSSTSSNKPSISSDKQSTSSNKPSISSNKQRISSDKQSVSSNKQSTSSNKKSTSSDKQRASSNKKSASSNESNALSSNKESSSSNNNYQIEKKKHQENIRNPNKSNQSNKLSELNGNIGLNPNYEKISPNHTNYTYIPIVGIDDVHGLFFPKVNKIKIGNKTLTYKTGGLEYITKYINILREEFGAHRVLFFDGGDFYQGGIDSVLFDGDIMTEFYNLLGVNGTTIGNHEFDYSKSWIESKVKKGNYKMLINNIRDNTTKKKKEFLEKIIKLHIYIKLN